LCSVDINRISPVAAILQADMIEALSAGYGRVLSKTTGGAGRVASEVETESGPPLARERSHKSLATRRRELSTVSTTCGGRTSVIGQKFC
jgi:hypothetical protein